MRGIAASGVWIGAVSVPGSRFDFQRRGVASAMTSRSGQLSEPPSMRRWAVDAATQGAAPSGEVTISRGPVLVRWRTATSAPAGCTQEARPVALWVVRPARTVWGEQLRQAQVQLLIAPLRSLGGLGKHSLSAVIATLIGAVLGASSGAYLIGGPLPLVWGAILGATVGYVLQVVITLNARRHLRGPVDDQRPELTAAVAELHDVVMRSQDSGSALLVETSTVARGLLWILCDPAIDNQQYRRLRYHALMLSAVMSDHDQAQAELVDATSVPGVGEWTVGQTPGDELIERAASLIEELRCRSGAGRDVADVIGLIRRKA